MGNISNSFFGLLLGNHLLVPVIFTVFMTYQNNIDLFSDAKYHSFSV